MRLVIKNLSDAFANVSRETCDYVFSEYENHLDIYSELIQRCLWWNRSVNLFSRSTDASALKNHILHSLFLMESEKDTDCRHILDAGTGGGLPGLPLAISNPQSDFLLVDKSLKKTLAVKDLIRGLSISNASVICSDIRNVRSVKTCRIVSKHAFHVQALLSGSEKLAWKEIRMLKGDDLYSELNQDILDSYVIDIKRIDLRGNPFFKNKFILKIINNQERHSEQ